MFDMSNDSHLFHTRGRLETDGWLLDGNTFHKSGEVCQPLYEGKMIWHFDHRFGTYEGQTQAQANKGFLPQLDETQHNNPSLLPMPRYWIHQDHLLHIMGVNRKAFLAFRDVTNAVVRRTSIFSIIPVVPCNHKLPLIILNKNNSCDLLYLQSCFASFIFDYVTRQKIGGVSLGFFILKQLPVLPPESYTKACSWDRQCSIGAWILPRALELTYTAWDLTDFARDCGYDGPPFRWDEKRRFLLRCELDAAYFHLYGIARDDVDYIMDAFRVWREKEEKQHGEYRTRRVILEIYDEMQRAMETGVAYQTRLTPGPADPAVAHEGR